MFSLNWKRPSSLEYPKVWHRFEKTNKDGKTMKFKVQDLTEEYHDNLFEMFMKDYIVNEPWSVNASKYIFHFLINKKILNKIL